MSKKKKTYTVSGHRKVQALKNKANESYSKGYAAGRAAVCSDLLRLIPISQQVIDTADVGLDVTIKCEISAIELLKIFRGE